MDTFIMFILPAIISLSSTTGLLLIDKHPKSDVGFYAMLYIVSIIPLINIIIGLAYICVCSYCGLKFLLLKMIDKLEHKREIKKDKNRQIELSETKKYKKLKKELINYNYFENEQAIEDFVTGTEVIGKLTATPQNGAMDDDDCNWLDEL